MEGAQEEGQREGGREGERRTERARGDEKKKMEEGERER